MEHGPSSSMIDSKNGAFPLFRSYVKLSSRRQKSIIIHHRSQKHPLKEPHKPTYKNSICCFTCGRGSACPHQPRYTMISPWYCGWLRNPNHQLIGGKHPMISLGFQHVSTIQAWWFIGFRWPIQAWYRHLKTIDISKKYSIDTHFSPWYHDPNCFRSWPFVPSKRTRFRTGRGRPLGWSWRRTTTWKGPWDPWDPWGAETHGRYHA